MFQNTRIKIASRFGKLEHFTSRVLGFSLFVLLTYRYLTNQEMIFEIILCALWTIYWMAHRIEKFFYGRGLR
jgi:hypothetical protein